MASTITVPFVTVLTASYTIAQTFLLNLILKSLNSVKQMLEKDTIYGTKNSFTKLPFHKNLLNDILP